MTDIDRLRLLDLLDDLEEGILSDAGRHELVARLKASDEAQQFYLNYQSMLLDLSEYAQERAVSADDQANALAVLAAMELDAEGQLVELIGELSGADQEIENNRRSPAAQDLLAKAISPFGLWIASGMAAVLALGITLTTVFTEGGGSSQAPSAATVQTPIEPTRPNAVATLTGQHDARWAHDAPQLGQALSPGQRLVLTQGFAEVTTARGAVVILEAPCTAELFDHPNALRLHSGKLVGICETESSKGFAVRTPQLDLVDYGTRFGVAVTEVGGSVAHVFEGSVGVKPNASAGASFAPRGLGNGETIALDELGQETEVASPGAQVFARLAQRVGGVTRLVGQVDWADSAMFLGTDESTWTVADRAFVFEESRVFTLNDTLHLSVLPMIRRQQATAVAPGTTIRTYILLFNPGGPRPLVAEGSVTFEGEILGVVTGDRWNEALRVLADGRDAKLFNADQRFGTIEAEFDAIDLHNDGHTLAFKLQAGMACDAIRIVVREPVGAQP